MVLSKKIKGKMKKIKAESAKDAARILKIFKKDVERRAKYEPGMHPLTLRVEINEVPETKVAYADFLYPRIYRLMPAEREALEKALGKLKEAYGRLGWRVRVGYLKIRGYLYRGILVKV